MSSDNLGARPEQGTGQLGRIGGAAVIAEEGPGRGGARNVLHVLGNRDFALFWVVTTLAGSAFALSPRGEVYEAGRALREK